MNIGVISSFGIVFRNYDVIFFHNFDASNLKALVNQEVAKCNTISYPVRINSYAR